MDIALVFPQSTFLTDPMVWPPLGLWYLGAQLERQGHHTEFFDLSFDKTMPADGEFDQMWLSATSPQIAAVRAIGEVTKDWTRTRTVFGGAAPWANPKTALELPFDLIVSGEGDHPETVARIVELASQPGADKHFVPMPRRDLDWVLPPIRVRISDSGFGARDGALPPRSPGRPR